MMIGKKLSAFSNQRTASGENARIGFVFKIILVSQRNDFVALLRVLHQLILEFVASCVNDSNSLTLVFISGAISLTILHNVNT